MPYFHDDRTSAFTFVGSSEKIALDKARVSNFRKQQGMNPDPHIAVTGSPEEVDRKIALLKDFKYNLR